MIHMCMCMSGSGTLELHYIGHAVIGLKLTPHALHVYSIVLPIFYDIQTSMNAMEPISVNISAPTPMARTFVPVILATFSLATVSAAQVWKILVYCRRL